MEWFKMFFVCVVFLINGCFSLTPAFAATASDGVPIYSQVVPVTYGKLPITQVRRVYSTGNVTTSAWVELIAETSDFATAIEVFDSSGQTLKIGVGASGSEVDQFNIVPGGNGLVPIQIPKGSRVAVKAVSGTANAGELDINLWH